MSTRKIFLSLLIILSPFAVHLFILILSSSGNGLWLFLYNTGMMVILAITLVNLKREIRKTVKNEGRGIVAGTPKPLTLNDISYGAIYRVLSHVAFFRDRYSLQLYDYVNNMSLVVILDDIAVSFIQKEKIQDRINYLKDIFKR